ncbi:MAG: SDR family NAD(P)-dependent oxidoreductase, partial [Sneathiellales bacterium]|nr:SDR family NAD(P)-dependent oxidoreductase [Sneathiellales bacterium]
MTTNALIVGTGPGLSTALVQLFTKEGISVSVAARDTQKLKGLCAETGATAYSCDASDPQAVEELFEKLDKAEKQPDLVVYNAGAYTRGAITELEADAVKELLMVNA